MQIIILHGDDTEKSYQRLKKFIETVKARSWEVSYLDEVSGGLEEQLSIPSLFGAERFFILKDLSKLGKKQINWITKKSSDLPGNLIIYHEGMISTAFVKALPKETKVEEFKLPVYLWNFLDNLMPGKAESSVKTLHKIIEKQPIEAVFPLIAKRFRDLYWIKKDPKTIPLQAWQFPRLKKQSDSFKLDQLLQLIGLLTDIDIKVKTSKAKLIDALDLLILKHLE